MLTINPGRIFLNLIILYLLYKRKPTDVNKREKPTERAPPAIMKREAPNIKKNKYPCKNFQFKHVMTQTAEAKIGAI